jgi:hypothetical protein
MSVRAPHDHVGSDRQGEMNEKEAASCHQLWTRNADGCGTFAQFQARFAYDRLNGCWLGQWCGMTMGIEKDGYTHS